MRFAFDELGVDEVCSLIHPKNARSIRVAQKIGETLDREIEWFGTNAGVWIARAF